MALQKAYADEFGNTNASAYHRVVSVTIDLLEDTVNIKVGIYKDAASRNAGKQPFKVKEHWMDFNEFTSASLNPLDKNPSKSSYTLMKLLDEYSGAIDV